MNGEELLAQLSAQCDSFQECFGSAAAHVRQLTARLDEILPQLHKNTPVRDSAFSHDFNSFCADLRKRLDEMEAPWEAVRDQLRVVKDSQWSKKESLACKACVLRAKRLSAAQDDFAAAYQAFLRSYKSFTAEKLNVFLLTSCQADSENVSGKILFLVRKISQQIEKNGDN